MTTPEFQTDMHAVRRVVSRHLVGTGVELGPGVQPFPLHHPGTSVRYLDRWQPEENQALFVELGDDAAFTRPDVACDLNVDRLKMLDDGSQDFVIASHVLEHLADPIGMLDEIHRVLRPAGLALVLLPDMRRTFDRTRPPTPLDHLVSEYEAGVTEIDDAHIDEFIRYCEADYQARVVDATETDRAALFDWHRRRSIHVHCWAEADFLPVLDFAIGTLGHRWEFVDGILTDDEGPDGIEFGYVLRRDVVDVPAGLRVERWRSTYAAWADDRRRVHASHRQLLEARETLRDLSSPAGLARHVAGGVERKLARRLSRRAPHRT